MSRLLVFKKSSAGITLIEMIVAVSLLTLFLVVVVLVINQGFSIWSMGSGKVTSEDQMRAVEDRMLRDLRPTIWVTTVTTPEYQRLYFSETATKITGTSSDSFYEISGTQIFRKLPGGNASPIANGIYPPNSSFSIIQIPQTPIRYRAHIQLEFPQTKSATKSVTFDIYLRNFPNE
jgi:hypothetical protein